MLEDLYIGRLNIQLTKKCNQRCRSCNSYHMDAGNELSLQEVKQVIGDACREWDIQNIALTGGEPTIRDDFLEIAQYAAVYAPNVSVTTNGYYFSGKDRDEKMLKGGGVNRYSFSYHGIGKQDEFTGTAGAEERIRNAISWVSEELKKDGGSGLYAKIGILFDGRNIADVEEMLGYAESKDMDLYIEIVDDTMPIFRQSDLAVQTGIHKHSEELVGQALSEIGGWIKKGRRLLVDGRGIEFMRRHYTGSQIRGKCPLGLTDVYIESNGDVRTGCWVLPPAGNIRSEPLGIIKNKQEYKMNVEKMLSRKCPGCTCGYLAQAKYMSV